MQIFIINYLQMSSSSIKESGLGFWPFSESLASRGLILTTGVIVETGGSVRKMQKRTLFHYRKVKKGTPNLTFPYVHSLFTIFLIKQIFEKNKSSRAASGGRTQF